MPDMDIILGGLYDAASGSLEWTDAIAPLGQVLASPSGILYIEGPACNVDILALPGWSPKAQNLYRSHYAALDPYAAYARRAPKEGCFLGSEVIDPHLLADSEIWYDFCRNELPAFHFVGAMLPLENDEGARLAWHRDRDAPAFDEIDRARLQTVMPHVRRALQLQRRLEAAQRQQGLLEWTLDSIELGLAIIDANNRLFYANPAAERLCKAGGLLLGGNGDTAIRASFHPDERRLRLLLARVAAGGAGGGLMLRLPGEAGRLAMLIHPLPAALAATWQLNVPSFRLGRSPTPALVSLRMVGAQFAQAMTRRSSPDPGRILTDVFDLTEAEAAVASRLAAGSGVMEIARSRGTSVHTIRTQVRQILSKTESKSLRELVTVLSHCC